LLLRGLLERPLVESYYSLVYFRVENWDGVKKVSTPALSGRPDGRPFRWRNDADRTAGVCLNGGRGSCSARPHGHLAGSGCGGCQAARKNMVIPSGCWE